MYSIRQEDGKYVLSAATHTQTLRKTENQPAIVKKLNDADPLNQHVMTIQLTAKPNPFFRYISLEVSCELSRNVIVRLYNEEGKILKMFSWFLVKGTNMTSLNDLSALTNGWYFVDIFDMEGKIIAQAKMEKEI